MSVSHRLIWVDGQPVSVVSADDRGLNYADGVFETMRYALGRAVWVSRHLKRLRAACERLSIAPPNGLEDLLAKFLLELKFAGVTDGAIKLILTRGDAARGYAPPTKSRTRSILSYSPHTGGCDPSSALAAREGARVLLCVTPSASSPALAGLKHLGRLENALAAAEWKARACDEGLMFNLHGSLVAGTMSNVFLAVGSRLMTPSLEHCGVAGVTREWIIERARAQGIETRVETISRAQLMSSSEIFLSNSLIGVWPVTNVAGRRFSLGQLSRWLQSELLRAWSA